MRYLNLTPATLHQLGREVRANMSSGEIAHAYKIARANMILQAKMRDAWRRQIRDDFGDVAEDLRRRFRKIEGGR